MAPDDVSFGGWAWMSGVLVTRVSLWREVLKDGGMFNWGWGIIGNLVDRVFYGI